MSWLLRNFRVWARHVLSALLVMGGVSAAIITLLAQRAGDLELTRVASIASLVFVLLISLFIVPPLVRSARSEIGRFSFPLQITSGGLIFTGILLVVAFAAWNTGNNLLFLILSVLASTLFVAWAAARSVLSDLVMSARFPDHIFASEAAPVIVTLHNTKRIFPSLSILTKARSRVAVIGETKTKERRPSRISDHVLAYFMYVPHRAKVEQRVELTFAKRGRTQVIGFELSTKFPFGFFRLRRRLRAREVDLIIYPKPEMVSDELHLLPITAGRNVAARRGRGQDLHSLRDYQPQDDLRHIDWKATARARRLTVREFTAEDERRVHIAVDLFSVNGSEEQVMRFERGVTLAASLVKHFIDERNEVCLTLGDEAGRYGTGVEHLYNCLRRLALVAPPAETTDSESQTMLWQSIARHSSVTDGNYRILLTAAAPGSLPSNVWRTSHVIYL